MQPQLFAVAVGEEDEKFLLKTEHVSWVFESLIKAVEVGLKTHFVLNLEYQYETHQLWSFIQTCLFGIETKNDKVLQKCRQLVHELTRNS